MLLRALFIVVGFASAVVASLTGSSWRMFNHSLLPTPPSEPVFKRVESNAAAADEYSSAHCSSSTLQKDAWRLTSCVLRNLCFNSSSKEFLFYAKEAADRPDPVSIPTFNFKWSTQYDNTVRFSPRVIIGPLPHDRLEASHDELWIPFLPFCPANIGHLIWDDFLTWFGLSWVAAPLFSDAKFSLRPLWYNPPFDPPWATCDWIRLHEGPGHSLSAGYSDRCTKNIKKWLPLMIGSGNEVIPETSKFQVPSSSSDRPDEIICFPKAAYGLTPYANQGSGHHGWNPTDNIPPSFGRAPILYQFTRHMMALMNGSDVPKRSLKEILVLFSSASSDRLHINFDNRAAAIKAEVGKIEKLVHNIVGHDQLRIVAKSVVLASIPAKDQLDMAAKTCVFVTAAGGGAFTAQFLPRGSSIILYQDSQGEHLHKGRVDWKVFNGATWMRSTYIDYKEYNDVRKLIRLIKEEILNCVSFMDALAV